MEWQGVITGKSGKPLGTIELVSTELATLFPDLKFERSTSGEEQLDQINRRGLEIPDFVARVVAAAPSFFCGFREDETSYVGFNLGSDDSVDSVWATVRGDDHQVASVVTALTRHPEWVVGSEEPLTVCPLGPGEEAPPPNGATLYFESERGTFSPPDSEFRIPNSELE